MDITEQQRHEMFDAATKTQARLYSDPESGAALKQTADKHPNIITNYKPFAIAVGDVILGLVPQEKLPDLLVERLQITRPEAMKVTADVLDFLAPLSQPTKPAAASVTPTESTESDTASLQAEIAQTEADLQSTIKPLRTMANDMEAARQPTNTQPSPSAPESTHQAASQTDLLAGNKNKNDAATWDTTQG